MKVFGHRKTQAQLIVADAQSSQQPSMTTPEVTSIKNLQ